MRPSRLAVAVAVPAGLAVFATSNFLARAALTSARPETAAGYIVGTGDPMAAAAQRAASQRRSFATTGNFAMAAVETSPLQAVAFTAAAERSNDPALTMDLLQQAHTLTRRNRPTQVLLAAQAMTVNDRLRAITFMDEMYRQSTGIEPGYALLASWLDDQAVRTRLATIFTGSRSWRSVFFQQITPRPEQIDGVVALVAELRRRGHPVTSSEIAPLLLRLATGSPASQSAGWRLWTRSMTSDPFRWPDAAAQAMVDPYEWTLGDTSDGDVRFDTTGLVYSAGDNGNTIVHKLTALPPRTLCRKDCRQRARDAASGRLRKRQPFAGSR